MRVDCNNPLSGNMEKEPMHVSAGRPGIDELRKAAQEVRSDMRMALEYFDPNGTLWEAWDMAAEVLQVLDEGSPGVVDMIL